MKHTTMTVEEFKQLTSRAAKRGDPLPAIPREGLLIPGTPLVKTSVDAADKACAFPGCTNGPYHAQQLCEAHYKQERRGLGLSPLRSRRFTESDDTAIRQWYADNDGKPLRVKDLAAQLNRTSTAVFLRASRLGLGNFTRKKGGTKRQAKYDTIEAARRAIGDNTRRHIAAHGHPRGMLGRKHSAATKGRLSETSRRAWQKMTKAQQAENRMKMLRTKAANGTLASNRKRGSWKAGWRVIGGVRKFYRSRWEANYARILQWQMEQGQIASWSHEPETFWFEKIKRGCRSYLPDFKVVFLDGRVEYHEVKGWFDARSKTKMRRMKKYHPTVSILLISGKDYSKLEKVFSTIIDGWE